MLQAALAYKELKCLDVHEELSLVVVCAASIDRSVANLWLERVRVPKLDRIYWLDVVVSIDKHCRKGRINQLLSENYRMTGSRVDCRFVSPGLHKKFHQALCAALHVRLMLFKRTHRRNPQK